MEYVRLYCVCAVVAAGARGGVAVPVRGQVTFPEDGRRQDKKIQEAITPPVLPVIPHLENDPSTLLPNESGLHTRSARPAPNPPRSGASPRFGYNQGFDVSPNSGGGVTASFSNGYSGLGGNSQAASHSLSFGFNNGFQASHSSSFSNSGFGSSSFSGSQASSQSSSFSAGANGLSASAAAASAAASSMNGISSAHGQSAGFGTSVGGNSAAGSQSASSTFGSGNSFANAIGSAISGNNFGSQPSGNANFGEGVLDIRHRAGGDGGYRGVATSVVFPGETSQRGRFRDERPRTSVSFGDNRWRGGAAGSTTTYRDSDGDWLAILVSD